MAEPSEELTLFDPTNTETVNSNPRRGVYVVRVYRVRMFCIGRGDV
jgi:hypothetical protein